MAPAATFRAARNRATIQKSGAEKRVRGFSVRALAKRPDAPGQNFLRRDTLALACLGVAATGSSQIGNVGKANSRGSKNVSVRAVADPVSDTPKDRRLELERDFSVSTADGIEKVKYRADGWDYMDFRGNRTHYIQHGPDDPKKAAGKLPIVLVHGFGASSYHWRSNIPSLAEQGHKVYALCLLGYGWSDKPTDADYSTALWGEQVAHFIENVVGQKSLVVGNSIGAIISLYVSSRHPELVSGVALLNAAGNYSSGPPREADRTLPNEGGDEDKIEKKETDMISQIKEGADYAVRRVTSEAIFISTKYRIKGILQNVYQNQDRVDADLVESIWKPSTEEGANEVFFRISGAALRGAVLDNSPSSLLSTTKSPVCLIWGLKDPWMQTSKAKDMLDLYPDQDVSFEPIEMGGHCPHDDCPKEVNEKLIEFAKKIKI